MTPAELQAALSDLVERGLLHRAEREGRFDLHPIVRRYAYDFLGREEREAAHRGLRDYFAAVPAPEKVKSLEDLVPVIELYHHMVRAGEYDAGFELFGDRLDTAIYYQLGASELCIEPLRALFPDSEESPPRLREERDQSWTLNELANSYSLSGQPRRAVALFERANEIHDRKGDKGNLAIGLGNLAYMAQLPTGALRNAEASLRRRIELAREVKDERVEASGHCELGRLLVYSGRWKPAESELRVALEIFEKRSAIQPQGVVWAYRALLRLQVHRAGASQRPKKRSSAARQASDAARRALELAEETARSRYPHARDFVRTYWLLGATDREAGDPIAAERRLAEALTRCRRINMVDHEADILIDLARLRALTDEPEEERRLAEEALTITNRCGYVLQEADAHLVLSRLDLAEGKREAALEHAREARRLARCDGPPDYTYKVAWDEAGVLLAELGVEVVEE
jgi:tetratricopeptide (TPR) repeat protein